MPVNTDVIAATAAFRSKILAVLVMSDWLVRYGDIIMPEYFETKTEQALVRWVRDYYNNYHAVPEWTEVAEIGDPELLTAMLQWPDTDLRYAVDYALDFCKSQAMKLAILESVDDIKKGDLHVPLERVKQAQAVGTDKFDLGFDLVDDVTTWLFDELHGRRYPTGWQQVDQLLDGGLIAGEYGLMMAPPNGGKTASLINIGYALAGLYGSANVLHCTLEMAPKKVLKRYALRVADIKISRGSMEYGSEQIIIRQLQDRAKQRLKGKLRVAYPGRHIIDIKNLLDRLRGEGFDTQALIVDYADLLEPSRRQRERRFELADTARELRQLGYDYGVPVWSATQARREAIHKEFITMEDIAEAIEKAAIADVIISVCRTADEEKMGTGRLFMAKMRDAESAGVVPVSIDFSKQAIVDRGRVLNV